MSRFLLIFYITFSYFWTIELKATEFTISQEYFLRENYEYVISDTCNLNGNEIILPIGCMIKFIENGCIKNGIITFNDTKLINQNFLDCKYKGNIIVDGDIFDNSFCKNSMYDQDVLWWLIEQTANNSTTLELTKDYNISCSRIYLAPFQQNNRSYVIIENKSFTINGNGHTIYDNHEHKGHFSKDFIVLFGCKNVKIESLYFVGVHNEVNSLVKKGGTKFPAPGGTNVILCIGDTKGIRIVDGKCSHCSSYIWCGCDPKVSINDIKRNHYTDNLVVNGFEDIDVEIYAFDTHYPVAIYKGHNVRVRLHFFYARRACRLQGVDKADIQICGAFVTTPVMLMLKDAISYTDHTFSSRIYNACSNIYAKIVRLEEQDTITKYKWYDIALNVGCYNGLDSLATARQYFDRKNPYEFKNINVTYICDVQQYAILFSPHKNLEIKDIYEIKLTDCMGGGLKDSNISNEYCQLKLDIEKSELKKISMRFNENDNIEISNSAISIFENKNKSHPNIKSNRSIINYIKSE